MKNLGKILSRLRKNCGYTQQEVAEWLSRTSKATTNRSISKWEQGDTEPSIDQFLHLCRLYEVPDPLDAFLGEGITPRLNNEGQELLVKISQALEKSGIYEPAEETGALRRIRLYDIPASAGTGQWIDSDSFEWVEVEENKIPRLADFGIRVAGDSMEPRFHDGQTVWIHQQQTIENGEIGVFLYDGETYLKQFSYKEGQAQLLSLNTVYQPVDLNDALGWRVLGKVAE